MGYLNKTQLIGKIGNDLETRYTQGGTAVLEMSIATNEHFTDKTGQKQTRTEWHKVQVWGKQAENCGQFLSKGSEVYVEGKLKTEQFEDKQGVKRYVTKVHAFNVQFLGSNGNGLSITPDNKPINDSDLPF